MTALNLWVQPDAAHLITDAAHYAPDGNVRWFGPKVLCFSEAGVALSSRGHITAARLRQLYDATGATTKAEIIGAMKFVAETAKAQNAAAFPDAETVGMSDFSLTAIAWDDQSDKPIAWHIGTGGVGLMPGMDPLVIYRGGHGWMSPHLEDLGALDWDALEPDIDGARILTMQREMPIECPWGPKFHMVGGYGEATTLTRTGIVQRRIIEWPEDEVGKPIRPQPDLSTDGLPE